MKDFMLSIMRSLVCALCAAALGALSIALMLALYDMPRTVDLAVLHWGGTLLALSLVCELLIRHNPSALAYLIACGAILYFGGEQVITHTIFTPSSGGFIVFLRLCIWLSGVICALACRKEPGSNVFVRLSDVLILYIGLYMATLYGLQEAMILPVLGFALGALLLSMLISASLRAGGESDSVIRGTGMGGYLVIGALLLVCLLLAALLLSLAGGHVDGIVDAFLFIWRYVSRAAMSLMTGVGLILAFLFGGQRMMQTQQVQQQDSLSYGGGAMKAMETAPQWVVYLFMGVIAAVILVAIAAILWALRSAKIGRVRKKKTRRKVTRTSHIGAALRALLTGIASRITFELRYRANRRTPQGLYVFAVRTCRAKRIPRRKNESPGAYMRRLHGILAAQGMSSELDLLARMLDCALYGGLQPPLSREQADAFLAQIRAIPATPILKTQKGGLCPLPLPNDSAK